MHLGFSGVVKTCAAICDSASSACQDRSLNTTSLSPGTQTPRKNGRGVWAPGLPGCVSVRRNVGVPVIAIMTLYDVSAAQLFECRHGAHRLAQYRAAARVPSRAATHDVTEEEVTAWEK